MNFIVSEWGFHTEFSKFDEAVKYCVDNNLTDGEDGVLWINGTSREELEKFMQENKVDHEYMFIKCIDEPNNWTWCNIEEKWEDATQAEKEGSSDFSEKFEDRKKYIEERYGVNHGKTFTK